MDAVFFHGLRDVLPALLASLALYSVAAAVGAFACLAGLLYYIKHKQRETMVYMEKFPGRTEPIPMLTTWSIHRTLSKEAHRLDVGTRKLSHCSHVSSEHVLATTSRSLPRCPSIIASSAGAIPYAILPWWQSRIV